MNLEILNRYFCRKRMQPNLGKTEMCVFHLSTHDANRKLELMFDNSQIQHVLCFHPAKDCEENWRSC
jgi:hypothetical protein